MFRLNRNSIAPVVAEFIGTAVLVMIALILGQTTAVSYFIATSLAATAAVVYMLFSVISGAHVNPAVTFGMWTARKINTLRAISYIAAQLLAGVAAWQLFQYLTNHTLTAKSAAFSTPVFVGEVVGAGVVTMAYAAGLSKRFDAAYAGVMVGAAYFAGIVIAATASAGYINPAVALGSRAWSAAYVIGPLVGGLVGVNLYNMLFDGSSGSASAATSSPARSGSSKGVTVKRTTVRRRKAS